MLKTERFFSQLLLLFLPVQLTYHFWPDFSLIFGVRVDYLSPTIFFTDLLILAIIVIHLWNRRRERFFVNWILVSLFVLAVINIGISMTQPLSAYKWLRVFEYFLLGIVLSQQKGEWISKPLAIAAVFSGMIASLQFLLQRNIGGALYWIGERPLSVEGAGMATVNFFGQEFLRPYATFPHPNVLGAFGLISFLLLFSQRQKSRLIKMGIAFALLVIFLSFSQAIWLATIVAFLALRLSQKILKKAVYVSLVGVILVSVLTIFARPTFKNYALDSRIALANTAGYQWNEAPILGLGLGNFIPANQIYVLNLLVARDARLRFQPVHNIPLLLLAEVGIVGLVIVAFGILKFVKRASKIGLVGILIVFVTSFVDHYWLTLHQGTLLLTLVLIQLANGKNYRQH